MDTARVVQLLCSDLSNLHICTTHVVFKFVYDIFLSTIDYNVITMLIFFGGCVSQMGVSNDSHVVLYDNNPNFGFYSVGRVWWMFKVGPHASGRVMWVWHHGITTGLVLADW